MDSPWVLCPIDRPGESQLEHSQPDRAHQDRAQKASSRDRSHSIAIAQLEALLARSCRFDRADRVCEETLFDPGLHGIPRPVAVWSGDRLAGIAASSASWLRIVAVDPQFRGLGVGSALVEDCERAIARSGSSVVRLLDEPGNYLAPGIDQRNRDTIAWLERRGYVQRGHNTNLLIDVLDNPRVTPAIADTLADACKRHNYLVRRANQTDAAALDAMIRAEFSAGWAFEVGRALGRARSGVHVAVHQPSRQIAAFAAHDGNNRGLGWFGPAGTLPDHRGRGLGRALLVACLLDVAAAGHPVCEVAWIGPREFYDRVAGIAGQRRFAVMRKAIA
ncbi:MAG: GNAT family N-acetyltransferase [Proteobacteria bacterium]|nr:GNAT family N-acetyltransferase [Pseudomonadota bacterium]